MGPGNRSSDQLVEKRFGDQNLGDVLGVFVQTDQFLGNWTRA